MVYLAEGENQHRLLRRVGTVVDGINADLQTQVDLCHNCFPAEEHRQIEILAVPLAQQWGLDAFCNVWTQPVTILVDVGKVERRDWLRLVVHEYAHAHVGKPGHHRRFVQILSHLCLGLGLEPPSEEPDLGKQLRHWPPYRSRASSLDFWLC